MFSTVRDWPSPGNETHKREDLKMKIKTAIETLQNALNNASRTEGEFALSAQTKAARYISVLNAALLIPGVTDEFDLDNWLSPDGCCDALELVEVGGKLEHEILRLAQTGYDHEFIDLVHAAKIEAEYLVNN